MNRVKESVEYDDLKVQEDIPSDRMKRMRLDESA